MGKRTIKKEKAQKEKISKTKNMIEFLENKWKNKVCYTCESCLEIAYTSELSNTTGYVTDEELIESSNNKLQHK